MKTILKIIVPVVVILLVIIPVTNKTFLKTTYVGINNKEMFIPKYSFFVKEGACTVATFYSLRSEEVLEKEIKEYMDQFKPYINNSTYGYEKDGVQIQEYEVSDQGLYRAIYITY